MDLDLTRCLTETLGAIETRTSPAPDLIQEHPAVSRREIAQSIAQDLGLTQVQAKRVLQKVFDAILQTLVEEERVELRNFGIFQVKRRGPRKARNPKTGEEVFVPKRCVVTFKPGQVMQQRVAALGNTSAADKSAT
jgi:nucleoid DNA-binding protein